jgi:hypothetical protein
MRPPSAWCLSGWSRGAHGSQATSTGGEEGDVLEEWAQDVIALGPRPEFEMEQVLPGSDPDEPDLDPIIQANEMKDAGHPARRAAC